MAKTRQSTETLRPTAALLGASIAVGAAIDKVASEPSGLDSTTSDLLLRLSLSESGSLRGVQLCEQLQLSPSYVSRRVDRAVADGLVERGPDPLDRRAQLISLTDAGQAAVSRFTPHLLRVVDDIVFATLTPPEVDKLVELLERLELAATSLLAQPANDAPDAS